MDGSSATDCRPSVQRSSGSGLGAPESSGSGIPGRVISDEMNAPIAVGRASRANPTFKPSFRFTVVSSSRTICGHPPDTSTIAADRAAVKFHATRLRPGQFRG